LAKKFDAPIINADAFQIYKEMNIGTNKIKESDPFFSNHYLLNVVAPDSSFNVKEYQQAFRNTLSTLLLKNKNVVVCGGTGLYIRAALFDYCFPDEEERNYDDLEKMNNEELFNLLLSLDKEAASKTHQNNRKRVIRAITLIRNNQITKTELIKNQEHKVIYDNVKFLFINPPRDQLYNNINIRVEKMFDDGLVNEVKTLLNKYDLSITAKQGIGYKEVIEYLEGKNSLEECKELIKQRTRNYAKRQVTFFKHQFTFIEFASNKELMEAFK